MKKHTPGPWAIHDGGRFGVYGDLGPSVCQEHGDHTCQPLVQFCGPADVDECRANAHLIAAAPDLLEALEAVARVISVMDSPITEISILPLEVAKQVAAAIAKAKGES